MNNGKAAVHLDGLVKRRDGFRLGPLHLTLDQGAVYAMIGANGSGKSTLLRICRNLIKPDSGTLRILGLSYEAHDLEIGRQIAYVPQADTVDWSFPVRVRDVVMMGRSPRIGLLRRPGRRDHEIVEQALEQVGMHDFRDAQIGELSGGQRQRVFLARVLAQESNILLLDEPVSGVDAVSQHQIFELLEKLCGQGKTALVASHDLSCVAQRFDHFAVGFTAGFEL